jgi:hypothetical protein
MPARRSNVTPQPVSILAQPVSRLAGVAVGKTASVVKQTNPAVLVVAVCVFVAGSIIAIALAVRSKDAENARRKAEDEATAARTEAIQKEEAQAAASAKLAADRQRAADIASAKAQSAAMDRARRDRWIKQCVSNPACNSWQLDAIIEGAPPGAERTRALRIPVAAGIQSSARKYGKDGDVFSEIGVGMIAGSVARDDAGLAIFDLLPQTNAPDARKDPDSARGSAMKVSGTIVEIRAEGSVAQGALATGNLSFIRFVTAMSTQGLYPDSWATFVGVFVQEYDYPNVSGGQTRSLLVVGAFDIPQNRKAAGP